VPFVRLIASLEYRASKAVYVRVMEGA